MCAGVCTLGLFGMVKGLKLQRTPHPHRRSPAIEHRDRITTVEKLLGDRGGDQPGASDDQHAHRARR
jgi:hypothetical protein